MRELMKAFSAVTSNEDAMKGADLIALFISNGGSAVCIPSPGVGVSLMVCLCLAL